MFKKFFKKYDDIDLLDLNTSKALFLKIYDDTELADNIVAEINKNTSFYNSLVAKGLDKNWKNTLKQTPFAKLCVTFAYLPHIYAKYKMEGIEEGIFFDTFSDIKVWINDYYAITKQYGLDEFNWILNHLNFEIFKIGRLQYQLTRYFCLKPYKCDDKTFSSGMKIIGLHIPRGKRLESEECIQSFKQAQVFLEKHFPKYPRDVFFCYSWLLHSSAKNYMKKASNILKFADLFYIIEEKEAPNQAYRWLFSKIIKDAPYVAERKKNGAYYTQEIRPLASTSLQKAALNYIEKGGVLGDALGAVDIKNLKK